MDPEHRWSNVQFFNHTGLEKYVYLGVISYGGALCVWVEWVSVDDGACMVLKIAALVVCICTCALHTQVPQLHDGWGLHYQWGCCSCTRLPP